MAADGVIAISAFGEDRVVFGGDWAPILTAIPYIETQRERMALRRRNWIVAGFASLIAVAFLLGIHLLLKPLPQLVGSLLRKFVFW